MQRASKYWQIAGVIVAIISISFNVFQYAENKAKEYTIKELGGRLTDATAKWLGAERRITEHEKTIAVLTDSENMAMELAAQYKKESIYYFNESKKHEALAEYFQKKANEPVIPLQFTDDEHYRFFTEWTSALP